MQSILTTYPGSDRADVVEIFASQRDLADAVEILGTPERLIHLNERERLRDISPLGVHLQVKSTSQFNAAIAVIATLDCVRFLSIPSILARHLTDTAFPPRLEVLMFPDEDAAQLPRDLSGNAIVRLSVGRIRGHRCQFASLKHLDARIDSAAISFMQHRELASLNARDFRDECFLDALCPTSLQALGLRGGRTLDLGRLERFRSLRTLWIQEVRSEIDFAPLSKLPSLQQLAIGYCDRQRNAEVIGELPLESLHVFGCKDRVLRALAARSAV